MAEQEVQLERAEISACTNCPICDKLLRNATTINQCLHTFCRKCIKKKFVDEELECCPVCNIDLGYDPMQKLRPDHRLQDIIAKIFPSKRRRINLPEAVPSATLPMRRKERSLSSLVVSTPRMSTQTAMTGKRSNVYGRKKSRGAPTEKHVKKEEEDSIEDRPDRSSSPETLNKFSQNLKQNSSTQSLDKGTGDGVETSKDKVDLWKPLNYLVEVANRSKFSRIPSLASKSESPSARQVEGRVQKTKDQAQNSKAKKDPLDPDLGEPLKRKKLRRNRKKKTGAFEESGLTLQDVLDVSGENQDKRIYPIWFSLVASEDQEGEPLPQIPANYMRIKNGDLPVAFIHKYLVKKFELASEDEVEIKCMGQSVMPTLQLDTLLDLWLQSAAPSEMVPVTIGSSARDFVMVLAYARKVPTPH